MNENNTPCLIEYIYEKDQDFVQSLDLSLFDINKCGKYNSRILLNHMLQRKNFYSFSDQQIDYIVKHTDFNLVCTSNYNTITWLTSFPTSFIKTKEFKLTAEHIDYIIDNTDLSVKNSVGYTFLDFFISNNLYVFNTSQREKIWSFFFNKNLPPEIIHKNLDTLSRNHFKGQNSNLTHLEQLFLDTQDKESLLSYFYANPNISLLIAELPFIKSYAEKKDLEKNLINNKKKTNVYKI